MGDESPRLFRPHRQRVPGFAADADPGADRSAARLRRGIGHAARGRAADRRDDGERVRAVRGRRRRTTWKISSHFRSSRSSPRSQDVKHVYSVSRPGHGRSSPSNSKSACRARRRWCVSTTRCIRTRISCRQASASVTPLMRADGHRRRAGDGADAVDGRCTSEARRNSPKSRTRWKPNSSAFPVRATSTRSARRTARSWSSWTRRGLRPTASSIDDAVQRAQSRERRRARPAIASAATRSRR